MRMILNAPAVTKLVELDPDGTVELAKAAASQVANEIAQRMTRDAVTQRIDSFVAADLEEGDWYRKHIASKYQQKLLDTMATIAGQFMASITDGEIKLAIAKHIDATWNEKVAQIDATLNARAEQILRERFSAMFAKS